MQPPSQSMTSDIISMMTDRLHIVSEYPISAQTKFSITQIVEANSPALILETTCDVFQVELVMSNSKIPKMLSMVCWFSGKPVNGYLPISFQLEGSQWTIVATRHVENEDLQDVLAGGQQSIAINRTATECTIVDDATRETRVLSRKEWLQFEKIAKNVAQRLISRVTNVVRK